MIQYIEKLFQETKTIILPGLGALTITNPDTKELMYMPFLKHDDGALASFIEKDASISAEEAKKMVSDSVNGMLNDLESGKSVKFGNYGSFTKGTDGEFEFENSSDATTSPAEENPAPKEEKDVKKASEVKKKEEPKKESTVPPVTPATPVAKEERSAVKEAKKTPEKEVAEKKNAAPKNEEKKSESKPKEAPKKETPKAAATVKPEVKKEAKEAAPKTTVNQTIPDLTSSKDDAVIKEKNILEKEEIASNQGKLDALKKQKGESKKKRKRGAGFYILLTLLVIIIGGGTFVALNFEKAKEYLPFLAEEKAVESNDKEEIEKLEELVGGEEELENENPSENSNDEETAPDEEEAPVDEEVTPEEEPETSALEKTKPPVTSGSNDQPYHIVAGVFSEASNAERLADKIKGMGYPAKTFKRGAQTVVSVQSYATAGEAQTALSSVTDAAPKGWVLEWR